MVPLNYMGTGWWGVSAPPPVELVQEFIPMEGVGEVRILDYEEFVIGRYHTHHPEGGEATGVDGKTSTFNAFPKNKFGHILEEMHEAVVRESEVPDNNFFEGHMEVEIVQFQEKLRRMTVTVFWEEVPEGSESGQREPAPPYIKKFFFHEDSHYELME
jgi:hypothetical protein